MKSLLIPILTLLSYCLYAQTEIQGGIYNDQTWLVEQSPYLITGDVVLFPDKTLTIEPGVEIVFQDDYYFEIRGHFNAIGSVTDTIKFSTLIDSIKIDSMPWSQFIDWESEKTGFIIDYPSSSLKIAFCSFSNFKKALHTYNISNDDLEIQNCVFKSNLFGFTKYSTDHKTLLDSCTFIENSVAVYTDYTTITYGTFNNNYFAVKNWFQNYLSHSSFVNNSIGIERGSRGFIEDCNFEQNDIGVYMNWQAIKMKRNTIVNNGIGIRFALGDTTSANMLTDNQICSNSIFNVENISSTNIALNSNCWCTSDSTQIEDKIYDGYDNITSGLINYDIFNESCSSVLKSVRKVNIYTGLATQEDFKYSIYPIPFDDFINVSLPSSNNKYLLRLMDMNGRIIYNASFYSVGNRRISTPDLQTGTYILELSNGNLQKQEILIKR